MSYVRCACRLIMGFMLSMFQIFPYVVYASYASYVVDSMHVSYAVFVSDVLCVSFVEFVLEFLFCFYSIDAFHGSHILRGSYVFCIFHVFSFAYVLYVCHLFRIIFLCFVLPRFMYWMYSRPYLFQFCVCFSCVVRFCFALQFVSMIWLVWYWEFYIHQTFLLLWVYVVNGTCINTRLTCVEKSYMLPMRAFLNNVLCVSNVRSCFHDFQSLRHSHDVYVSYFVYIVIGCHTCHMLYISRRPLHIFRLMCCMRVICVECLKLFMFTCVFCWLWFMHCICVLWLMYSWMFSFKWVHVWYVRYLQYAWYGTFDFARFFFRFCAMFMWHMF